MTLVLARGVWAIHWVVMIWIAVAWCLPWSWALWAALISHPLVYLNWRIFDNRCVLTVIEERLRMRAADPHVSALRPARVRPLGLRLRFSVSRAAPPDLARARQCRQPYVLVGRLRDRRRSAGRALGRDSLRSRGQLRQRGLEVGDQILPVLGADRDAHECIRDPGKGELRVEELAMRRRLRVTGERLDAAQAHGIARDLQAAEKLECAALAAL